MRNNSYFIDIGAVSAVVDVQQRLIFFFGQKSVAAMAATAATLLTPLNKESANTSLIPRLAFCCLWYG